MQHIKLRYVYGSLFMSLLLQLLPWTGVGLKAHPDFILLTLLFWLIRTPQYCNIGTAWFAGLVMDLITGGIFGQNALAYAISAFFAVSYQRRLALFNVWQQAAYVFVLLLLTQTSLLILKLFAGADMPNWDYLLPSFTGIALWQFFIFLRPLADSHASQQ